MDFFLGVMVGSAMHSSSEPAPYVPKEHKCKNPIGRKVLLSCDCGEMTLYAGCEHIAVGFLCHKCGKPGLPKEGLKK